MLARILSRFRNLATPTTPLDQDGSRIARIIALLCLGFALGGILVIVHNILGGRWRPVGPVALGVASLAIVAALNRRGRIRAAAFTLVFAFLATVMLLLYTAGQGIRDISALFLPVTLMMAGLLLSWRDYILVAIIVLAGTASVIISELTGILVTRFSYFTTARTLLDVMVIMTITAVVVGFLTQQFNAALAKAHRHQAALMQSRAALSGILNSVPQAIFWKDTNGVYLGCNEVFARAAGLNGPEDVVGKTDFDLPWPREDAELYRADDREVIVSRRPKRHMVSRLRQADGTLLWIDTTKVPLLDPEGRPAAVLGVYEDITERKRAEEEIQTLNDELEDRVADRTARLQAVNEELESFSYSVSHDLRAPLRRIDGFSHVLAENYRDKLDDQGREYLAWVHREVCRMAQLIEDLLNLSRISRRGLSRTAIDLSTLARDAIADLRANDPDRLVDVILPEHLVVDADENLLRIVLENLLGNAWKFTRERSPARIELGADRQNGQTVYFVRDNGAGFDMAQAAKLFAPFQRLHSEKEFEGTGIGLAIVQRIIARHGGRIWATAVPGRGATIYFTLPPTSAA